MARAQNNSLTNSTLLQPVLANNTLLNSTMPPINTLSSNFSNNSTTSFQSTVDDSAWKLWIAVIFGVVIIVGVIFERSVKKAEERLRVQREQEELRQIESTLRRRQLVQAPDRKALIEKSLITKTVTREDQNGNLIFRKSQQDKVAKEETRTGTFHETAICGICLDYLRVGDVVSWSRMGIGCNHVFHHTCIVPWLQNRKHDDCPFCRTPILFETKAFDAELGLECRDSSMFMIADGLISPLKQASSILKDKEPMKEGGVSVSSTNNRTSEQRRSEVVPGALGSTDAGGIFSRRGSCPAV